MPELIENVIQTDAHEPTLYDVMDVLGTMSDRMDGMDVRFDSIDTRFNTLERDMNQIKVIVLDNQETLEALANAVDKYAVMIIDHERRITQLER